MADSYVVLAVSHANNTSTSVRFWTKQGADVATDFLSRHANFEVTQISDPTPDTASAASE